jgi:hypothetical protein
MNHLVQALPRQLGALCLCAGLLLATAAQAQDITTVAGDGINGYGGDGAQATASPAGIPAVSRPPNRPKPVRCEWLVPKGGAAMAT